jgi:hypothetical protein
MTILCIARLQSEAQRQAEDGIVFSGRSRYGFGSDLISGQLGLIRTLRGLTDEFGHLDDGQHSEAELERHFANEADRTLPACWYWIRKLQARFFSGNYVSAVEAAEKARPLLWSAPAMFETAEYHFFNALSRAALFDLGSPDEQQQQAIRSAQANGFVHNEALANELAARFYVARGFEKIANGYLRDARYLFLRWGADGKVRQLDELYPHLREEEQPSSPTTTIEASVEHLDLATIIKVLQTVSGEIVLEKLIDTLMRAALEHAGAERGLFPSGLRDP